MVSSPKAPDPYKTADAQSQYNQNTAVTEQLLNMTDQVTPYGNVTYTPNGTTPITSPDGKTYQVPRFTQTTTLNPEQQSTLGYTQDAANNIAQTANSLSSNGLSALSQPVDTSGAPALQTGLGNGYSSTLGNDYNTSLGGNYSSNIGNDYSTNLGGNYSTSLGSGYSSNIGNGYSTSLGSDYNTSFGSDVSQAMTSAKNAVLNQLTPTLDRNAEATRAQELASGVRSGSAAYSANEQSIGDNYTRAANQATETAQSVQNQLFNQQQQQAAYTDSALLNKANYTNSAALNQAQFGNSALLNQAQFGNDSTLNQFNAQNSAALNQAQFGNESALNQFNAQNSAALNGQNFSNSALLNSANFNNDARNQYLSQYYQQRDQPLNELSALLSGSQVTNANTTTSATPTATVQPTNYSGLVEDNYQSQLAQSQGLTSGLFGLAGAGAMVGGSYLGRK